jgi:hypothetical protein
MKRGMAVELADVHVQRRLGLAQRGQHGAVELRQGAPAPTFAWAMCARTTAVAGIVHEISGPTL